MSKEEQVDFFEKAFGKEPEFGYVFKHVEVAVCQAEAAVGFISDAAHRYR